MKITKKILEKIIREEVNNILEWKADPRDPDAEWPGPGEEGELPRTEPHDDYRPMDTPVSHEKLKWFVYEETLNAIEFLEDGQGKDTVLKFCFKAVVEGDTKTLYKAARYLMDARRDFKPTEGWPWLKDNPAWPDYKGRSWRSVKRSPYYKGAGWNEPGGPPYYKEPGPK